jgi:hypothetical protein
LTHGSDLYIGGDLFTNGVATFGLARLSDMGPAIEPLLPNHANYTEPGPGPVFINAMVMHDGLLYIVGHFTFYDLMLFGSTVAVFDGILDGIEPMMGMPATGNAIAMMANKLVVGGDMPEVYEHIASLDMTTGISGRRWTGMNISPNPAVNDVVLELTDGGMPALVEVLDAAGRIVPAPVTRQAGSLRIDVRSLAPGQYTVRAAVDGEPVIGRFIKE